MSGGSLWALVHALNTALVMPGVSAQDVATVAGAQLVQTSENEYTRTLRNAVPLRLADGVVVTELSVRAFKDGRAAPMVVVGGLEGACVTDAQVRRHVRRLGMPVQPNHPVPLAPISRKGWVRGHPVWLTWRYVRPECLDMVAPGVNE